MSEDKMLDPVYEETEQHKDSGKEEEKIISQNCDHIEKFLEQLNKNDTDRLSTKTQERIDELKTKLTTVFALDNNHVPPVYKAKKEVVSENTQSDSEAESEAVLHNRLQKLKGMNSSDSNSSDTDTPPIKVPKKKRVKTKTKKSDGEAPHGLDDRSIIEILVDKIDSRKVPKVAKFDELSGQHLKDYLTKFEDYCTNNIRGGKSFWINELEEMLTGDVLEAFKAIKDVGDSYNKIKTKMLAWYDDMKESRKKKAREQFKNMRFTKGDTLYLFSNKLEKTFKRAYPNKEPERSNTLRDKFIRSIPKAASKQLSSQIFSKKLDDKVTTWSSIQRFARHKDVWAEQSKKEEAENSDTPQTIFVNTNEILDGKNKISRYQSNNNVRYGIYQSNNDQYGNYRSNNDRFNNDRYNNDRFDNERSKDKRNTGANWRDCIPPKLPYKSYQGGDRRDSERRPRRESRDTERQDNQTYPSQTVDRQCYTCGRSGHISANCRTRNRFSAPPQTEIRRCYTCGRMGHLAKDCKSRIRCYACGKVGHYSSDCRGRQRRSESQPPNYRTQPHVIDRSEGGIRNNNVEQSGRQMRQRERRSSN